MADAVILAAEPRDRAGKGAARATRRAGRVPAVIYGQKKDPVMISLEPIELMKQLRQPGFFGRVFQIEVGGASEKCLARDLQLHPVSDEPIHVDFMRFGADTTVHVDVEVTFENEEASPGLKRGGVLNVVRHTIELICPADAIPAQIVIDLTGLDFNDSVHISAVQLPEGVTPAITDRDFTIATIGASTAAKDEAAEAAAEGEDENEAEGDEE
ncbi:MAG: 50S ribosomal protein L25/general stress protein Ctc [Rhodobacterales bacterium]|nr:50S ribosomal protein L25/general stress protein Ctc [Rhodobacterales bacterium]